MLRKITLITLITALLSALLLAAGLLALDWYLGTERFRERLALLVSETYGYEVTFEGELGVSVYPWLGLETGPLSIRAEPNGEPLLRASEVSAKVALVPLFSQKLEFDTIFLNHIDVMVRRAKDGTTNVDELVEILVPHGEARPVHDPSFRVRSVRVRGIQMHNAGFRYVDEATGKTWIVSDASFQTGEYTTGQPLPFSLGGVLQHTGVAVEARLDVSGNMEMDFEAKALRLVESRLNLILRGAELPVQGDEVHFTSKLALDTTKGTCRFDGFHLKLPHLLLDGSVECREMFSSPSIRGTVRSGQFSPREVVNDIFPETIPDKDNGIFRAAQFALRFDADMDGVRVADLAVVCDDTRLDGALSVQDFADPEYSFQLHADVLDFDRYYRLFIVDEPFYLDDFFPSFFQGAKAEADLTLDSVTLGGEELKDSRWAGLCADGKVRLELLSADVLDGTAKGVFQASIAANQEDGGYALGLDMDMALKGMALGDLPLVGSALPRPQGRGEMRLVATVPPMHFQGPDVVDDVLLGIEGELAYKLRDVRLTSGSGKETRRWNVGNVEAQVAFSPLGERSGEKRYAFTLSGGGKGAGKDFSSWLSLDGRFSVTRRYEDVRLDGMQVKGRYEGSLLPEYAPAMDFSVSGALRVDTQRLHLRDIRMSCFDGEVLATLEGHRVFEKDYTLTGLVSYETDNPMGLLHWMSLKPGKPRGENAYSHLRIASQYSLTPLKAVFHHCEIGMDGAEARGVIRVEDLETGRITFDLSAGSVDIDQYRPKKKKRRDPHECVDPTQLRPILLPLETLRDLRAEGTLRVKDLLLYKLHFTDLRADVLARDGQLTTSALDGTFYGGELEGGFTARAAKAFIVMSLNLRADDFRAGPFMADIGGKEYVMGTGVLFLDVQSMGRTDDDIIANLDGRGGFTVLDGSYKFSGKPGNAKLEEGDKSILDGRNGFTGAGALFRIEDGGFYNEDFSMDATFMELSGAGNFNINTNTIDLDLVANYSAGPTVPLHVVGCLDDPAVEVPGGELITNTVRDLIGIPLKPFQYLRDLFF